MTGRPGFTNVVQSGAGIRWLSVKNVLRVQPRMAAAGRQVLNAGGKRNRNLKKRNTKLRKWITDLGKWNTGLAKRNTDLGKGDKDLAKRNTDSRKRNMNPGKANTSLRKGDTNFRKGDMNLGKAARGFGKISIKPLLVNTDCPRTNVGLGKKIKTKGRQSWDKRRLVLRRLSSVSRWLAGLFLAGFFRCRGQKFI